jgi:hypothetical protein
MSAVNTELWTVTPEESQVIEWIAPTNIKCADPIVLEDSLSRTIVTVRIVPLLKKLREMFPEEFSGIIEED